MSYDATEDIEKLDMYVTKKNIVQARVSSIGRRTYIRCLQESLVTKQMACEWRIKYMYATNETETLTSLLWAAGHFLTVYLVGHVPQPVEKNWPSVIQTCPPKILLYVRRFYRATHVLQSAVLLS